MQHSRLRVTHVLLKVKIGLYFCNIVAFTYRSRMLDEVQKCLNHLKDNIIECSPSSQGAPKIFNGGGVGSNVTRYVCVCIYIV